MFLAASDSGLNHRGFPVHKKHVAAGPRLVWLLTYAIEDTGFLSLQSAMLSMLAFHPLAYGHIARLLELQVSCLCSRQEEGRRKPAAFLFHL